MINLKIFGVTLVTVVTVAASIGLVTIGSQSTMASFVLPDAFIDEEEAAEAGNATMAGSTNQTNTNGNRTDVQFLSIQNAQSGSLSPVNDTAYTLELGNASNSTILFSDRPERIAETVSTADFIGNWTDGSNTFASDQRTNQLYLYHTKA